MPVLDAMRLIGRSSQAGLPVGFILGIVAVKKKTLTFPFKGQNVGNDSIQKPAVMADHQGAAAKILQGFFQGPHGIDVQIIGRFVKQKHIGPFL